MKPTRNLLIALGAFWISEFVRSVALPVERLNAGIHYSGGIASAVAMGFMLSLARSLAALIAGALVGLTAEGRGREWWSVPIAALYVIAARKWHFASSPLLSDYVMIACYALLPAVACVLAAIAAARVRRKRIAPETETAR